MKTGTKNPFQIVNVGGDLVQVWMGPPGEPESDFVCVINIKLVPQLITALRSLNA